MIFDFEARIKRFGFDYIFERKNLGGDVEVIGIGNSDNAKFFLITLIFGLDLGMEYKFLRGKIEKIGGRNAGLVRFDILPRLVELGMMVLEMRKKFELMLNRKTSEDIEETVGVAGDKIDFLMRNVKGGRNGGGDIFPPTLGGFGVVEPGSGKKLNFEVEFGLINFFDLRIPITTK